MKYTDDIQPRGTLNMSLTKDTRRIVEAEDTLVVETEDTHLHSPRMTLHSVTAVRRRLTFRGPGRLMVAVSTASLNCSPAPPLPVANLLIAGGCRGSRRCRVSDWNRVYHITSILVLILVVPHPLYPSTTAAGNLSGNPFHLAREEVVTKFRVNGTSRPRPCRMLRWYRRGYPYRFLHR